MHDEAQAVIDARAALTIAQEEADAAHAAWREKLKALQEAQQAVQSAERAALATLGIEEEQA